MNQPKLIITLAVLGVVALAAIATLLFMPAASEPSAAPVEETKPAPTSAVKTEANFDFGSAVAGTAAVTAPNASAPTPEGASAKEQTLETIQEAMTTYSAEGVPTLQPMLSNPDPEIRFAAMEAMKQLSVPEAAAALRAAANTRTDPEERKAMLDAAEFAELPSLISPGPQN